VSWINPVGQLGFRCSGCTK